MGFYMATTFVHQIDESCGFAGYCQITCGNCNCTSTVSQVLTQLQANTFLQAAEMTGLNAQFDLPGFTATILAPSDGSFAAYLNGRHCWSCVHICHVLCLADMHHEDLALRMPGIILRVGSHALVRQKRTAHEQQGHS